MTFNGDLGLIRGQVGKGQLMIDMEGEAKVYEGEGLGELVLAYCLSIHKAQGSEYPAVVIPILPEHTIMLRRNLIYTALTRARGLAVMVGSPRALNAALGRSRGDKRRTLLARRIREGRD
jgi:exodeoxyribonuclease V alpha subunit